MYSGFITTQRSIAAVGVHQRFDGAAYRLLAPLVASGSFPARRQIIHFEGLNGPDGLKTKSPGHHDPKHLYNPTSGRGEIPQLIQEHYDRLVMDLQEEDMIRAAFDAAWLAHYICDGLTPAHHFPLDEYLESHGRAPKARQQGFMQTMLVSGATPSDTLRRNWALWGGKGVLTTHFNFEFGVATALVGHRIRAKLNSAQIAKVRELGPVAFFYEEADAVADLRIYERFYKSGWTTTLGREVRKRLAPQIVEAIATMWLLAYQEAASTETASAALQGIIEESRV